ncbi:cytochrome ubiquinol oxidase subunit I [Thermodesulfobacteriota bacterium]
MDVVFLSRLQFAVATLFHFLFVPLTLGLVIMVAIMETKYVRTGDEEYKRMAKFWGKLFLINFALGVVTGITLEFQFGTNWSRYSKYVGDIFGSLLAIEATVAFFLESTFIGIWVFTWDKLPKKTHALLIWLVAIGSNLSAYWIIAANSFMQHPVGYVIRNGRAELENFWAIIFQPFTIVAFLHVLGAAWLLASFFVMGVSAFHILRKQNVDFFNRSFRIASVFALVCSIALIGTGDLHGKEMAKAQPTKLAAVESVWETQEGAPFYMLVFPDEKNEKNYFELIGIPKFLSWLALGDKNAEFSGLKKWPKEDRPPVTITFVSFRLMVGLGFLFVLVSIVAFIRRKKLESSPWLLRLLIAMIPLPYIAISLGWIVTEVGRQPWIVYNVMRTSDAASTLAVSQVGLSLAGFIVVYSLLGVACFFLVIKYAKKGPAPLPEAAIQEGR